MKLELKEEWLQYPFCVLKHALRLTLLEESGDEKSIRFQLGDQTTVSISLDVSLRRANNDIVVFECDEPYVRLYARRDSKTNGSDKYNQMYEMDYQNSILSGTSEGYSKINKAMYLYHAGGPVSSNNHTETHSPSKSKPRDKIISSVSRVDTEVIKPLDNLKKSSGDKFVGDIVVVVKGKLNLPINAALKGTLESFTKHFISRAILAKGAQALAIATDAKLFAAFVSMMLPHDIRLKVIDNSRHNYFVVSLNDPSNRQYQTLLLLGLVPLKTAISIESKFTIFYFVHTFTNRTKQHYKKEIRCKSSTCIDTSSL